MFDCIQKIRIAIVGAGVMGRLLAWQLARQGYSVSLFDRDPIESGKACSYTAAGMLTPFAEVEASEPLIFNMGLESLGLWPKIAQSLGGDLGLKQGGSLILAHTADWADLQRFEIYLKNRLAARQKPSQALGDERLGDERLGDERLGDERLGDERLGDERLGGENWGYEKLDSLAIARLEPELAGRFHQGVFLAQEASVCPRCVMQTLAEQLLALRVAWHASTEVVGVTAHQVRLKRQTHEFDWVVDCRGLGAKSDVKTLRGVRGELLWVEAKDIKIDHMVRLLHPRYRLYLLPRKKHLYVLGATQIESEDFSPISVRSNMELLSALYTIHPGFAEARIVDSKTNCRPALADNLPGISVENGLIRINGLFRHGFLLAPVLAREVCDYLSTKWFSGKVARFETRYSQIFNFGFDPAIKGWDKV